MQEILNKLNKTKTYLLLANILLVFFLILLSNLKILPIENIGDFLFLVFLFLALALYRPGWAFLFFIGTIALENINVAPPEIGFNIRPYQFFAALAIIAVITRLATKRLNFKLPKFHWTDSLLIIFTLAGFISALGSEASKLAIRQSAIAASFAAIYFLTRIFIQNLEDLKKIIPFFLSSSVVVVLYGIWQNVRFAHGLNSFEVMPGRPNSTFTEPDWLGIFLVFLLVVIYAIIYYCHSEQTLSERSESKEKSKNLIQNNFIRSLDQLGTTLLYIVLIASYITLILTVSRSAWLGALLVSIIYQVFCIKYFVIDKKNWKEFFKQLMFLATAGIISIAIVYFFNLTSFQLFNRAQSTGSGLQKITVACDTILEPRSRIDSINELNQYGCQHINLEDIEKEKLAGNFVTEIYRPDPNVNIRSQIYRKSWQEIKTHPVLGIGWGNIGNILGKDERGMGLNSSNIFLEVWLGTGILGLLAFILIWIYILAKGVKFFYNDDLWEKSLGLFLFIGGIALIAPNLFNAGIFMGALWLFFGISIISDKK